MPYVRYRHGIAGTKILSFQPDGITESSAYVKTNAGISQAYLLAIHDTPYILCYNAFQVLKSGGVIEGICIPGYITVHLSYCHSERVDRMALVTNEFAQVQAIGGRWNYERAAFESEHVVAWFALDVGLSRSNDSMIDCVYRAEIGEGDIITTVVYPFVNDLHDPGSGVEQYPYSTYTATGAPEGGAVIMSELKYLPTMVCPACEGSGCEACNDSGYVPIIPDLTPDILGEVKGSADTTGGTAVIDFDGTYTAPGEPHTHIYVAFYKGVIGTLHVEGEYTNELVCLSGDTRIRLYDGMEKRLDALDGSELLLASDGSPTEILRIKSGTYSMRQRYYTFSDGSVIHETNPHRFYNATQGFFQWLPDWAIGDEAVRYDGEHVKLIAVWEESERCEMFGLWTVSGTYFANGLLSGTAEANIPLLSDSTVEEAVRMAASVTDRQMEIFMQDGGIVP